MSYFEKLQALTGPDCVKEQEVLAAHTTFRIGGPADYYVEPQNVEMLVAVLDFCKQEKLPYFVLGNGSNLLVSDAGYRGVIISTRGFQKLSFVVEGTQTKVTSGSGVMLSYLASQVASRGLAGFEFASGIPGSLGGAVTMNAGAYGGEIKDCILSADVLCQNGQVQTLTKEQLDLSYRHSAVQDQSMIVLEATFSFSQGDAQQIQAEIRDLNGRRREKQPLEYGSAGSTFKRPEGLFAGKLIQDAGLRGYRVGDVMVSEKHCGFVVNVGQGTCAQAMQVIQHVQATVQEQFGVWLELEVKCLA